MNDLKVRWKKGLSGIEMILVTSIVFLFFYLFQIYQIHQTRHWLKTDARVVASEIISSRYNSQGRYNSIRLYPKLVFTFTYTVSGQQYSSARFYPWGSPDRDSQVQHYPVGTVISAIYDPENPAQCVVQPGKASLVCLVSSLIMLTLSFIGLYQYLSLDDKELARTG